MRRSTVLRPSPQIAFPDSTHNPKVAGSNPAHGAWRGKIAKMSSKLNRSKKKKVFETFSFERKWCFQRKEGCHEYLKAFPFPLSLSHVCQFISFSNSLSLSLFLSLCQAIYIFLSLSLSLLFDYVSIYFLSNPSHLLRLSFLPLVFSLCLPLFSLYLFLFINL